MGEHTEIGWTDHSFSPWWGCMKVSPGCKNCYAEAHDRRFHGGHWGPMAPRRFFADKHWAEPLKWDRAAAKDGIRRRVFCSSMADVFEDRADLVAPRARLWALIAATPHLDWLLLTKRPENLVEMLPWRPDRPGEGEDIRWGAPWPNVWLGTSMEDGHPDRHARVGDLIQVPAVLRFLSMEPLLEAVSVERWLWLGGPSTAGPWTDALGRRRRDHGGGGAGGMTMSARRAGDIGWIIAGCESGAGKRLIYADAFRLLRDECAAAEVPFFLKQSMPAFGPAEADGKTRLTVIGSGAGTKTKRDGVLVAPYLDGVQHLDIPTPIRS